MRFSKIVLYSILMSTITLGEEIQTSGYIEIGLITDYSSSDDLELDFYVEEVSGFTWDEENSNGICPLITAYNNATLYGIPEHLNESLFPLYGWDFLSDMTLNDPPTEQYAELGYGLYKFSVYYIYGFPGNEIILADSFYLDLRDTRYPRSSENDFVLKYDKDETASFSYRPYKSGTLYTSITNEDTLGIWEILDNFGGSPSIGKFEPTNPEDLTLTWDGQRVNLNWAASSPADSIRYQVWRKVMGGFRYLATIEPWTQLTLTDYNVTTYEDRHFSSRDDTHLASYKIRAQNVSVTSEGFSNVVSSEGELLFDKQSKQSYYETLPNEYSLYMAYPNPFNPVTNISFDFPEESRFDISIYNIQGRKVWEYVKDNMNAGAYTIQWDGKNSFGQRVASGVHIGV